MKSPAELIKGVLYKKDISQAKLAEMLNDSPQNFGRKLKSNDLSVNLLIQISQKLDHNFLFDMAKEIGVQFDTGTRPEMSIDELIEKKINKILNNKSNAKNYPISTIHPNQVNEP